MRKYLVVFFMVASLAAISQSIDPSFYQELQYRCIGPFRAGRTVGAVGIPTQPNVFFMGVNNGGVWKTTDYGRTWKPIFDSAPTGSVGDVAVSPSNPNILYVGTGEGLHRPDLSVGDGMYKSVDGGQTWNHIGLKDAQQIGRVIVHPTNPDIVFAAVLGHPYGANEERGVFRSRDGGQSWEKVLYINHNTGAIEIEFDPGNPTTIITDLWEHREGPWENGSFLGKNNGLYKSIDGGTTWNKIGKGLPTAEQGLGRIGFGIAPSNSKIVFATVDSKENGGIYRSEDGGENWVRVSTDRRLWGRGGDFAEIRVHPENPDVVFVANTAAYRSTDGGKTWTSFKGAPGGDDYHRIWINPLQPDIMLFAADQGAVVTVNGGKSWSSWLNQPTAQLYHISTDNQFPYWVYGGQQESGAIGIASRGNGGQISMRDWMGVGADEYAYVAADPKNADIIYGGRVTKFNKKTGQTQSVAPEALRSGQYRMVRTLPLLFHPADNEMLLFATNVLWKTKTGGEKWEIISPDLTRKQPAVPNNIGDFKTESLNTMPQRGVIYSVSGSPKNANIIWAGTDDGLVHVTRDGGKNWKEVTPASLTSWDKISQLDAGHFDENTAYLSVNAFRKDDLRPHIYKTHDGGATWKEIVNGISPNAPVNVVREDPKQAGLLFAGTEREVFFSVNEGENWQPLRMNMPATSIRDLVIHEDDLVVGTHGRSIWVMDNIAPLRAMAKVTQLNQDFLFPTSTATRVRFNMFSDTPIPPDEATGKNPSDGATIDYFISNPAKEIVLEILDEKGNKIRRYTSNDKPEHLDSLKMPHPTYWIRSSQILSNGQGHHRFVWDLRYAPPQGADRQFSIAAVYKNTTSSPAGPLVHPGTYAVRLTVDGKSQEQKINVRLDPRVVISEVDLKLNTDKSMEVYKLYHDLQTLRERIDVRLTNSKYKWKKGEREAVIAQRGTGDPENPDVLYGSIYASTREKETLVSLQEKLLYILAVLQGADAKPTAQMLEAINALKTRALEIKQDFSKLVPEKNP
ncbi:MAG: glycoside hydrolase [Chryseotalea sp. WA131a]|nr:MAG: glycoside hydrolase [Chryseotalea sp. WA131a]